MSSSLKAVNSALSSSRGHHGDYDDDDRPFLPVRPLAVVDAKDASSSSSEGGGMWVPIRPSSTAPSFRSPRSPLPLVCNSNGEPDTAATSAAPLSLSEGNDDHSSSSSSSFSFVGKERGENRSGGVEVEGRGVEGGGIGVVEGGNSDEDITADIASDVEDEVCNNDNDDGGDNSYGVDEDGYGYDIAAEEAVVVGGGGGRARSSTPLVYSTSNDYTYTDANLLASKGNLALKKVLDYLDVVRLEKYKSVFIENGVYEAKLRHICNDRGKMEAYLSNVIVVMDDRPRKLISSMLHNLTSKSCLHLCMEKWGGQYMCIQCYKYLNHDDKQAFNDDGHYDNLRDATREAREREIEASIPLDPTPFTASNLVKEEGDKVEEQKDKDRKECTGRLFQGLGIPIGWLIDFTNKNDCWLMTTREVCLKFIFPATATRRCRYVELDHMQGVVGPASTFISHCRAGSWGDLVAAVSDGAADRNRRVWIDIFACRQWPSSKPDLDFKLVVRSCSSFLLVCSSSLKRDVEDSISNEMLQGKSSAFLKEARSKIPLLRMWCLAEIFEAIQFKDMPILVKRGSYRKKKEGAEVEVDLIEFEPSSKDFMSKIAKLIDIRSAETSVIHDKSLLFDHVKIGTKNEDEILVINGKIRDVISSLFMSSPLEKHMNMLQNASCKDSEHLALLNADPSKYVIPICTGGFTNLLKSCIFKSPKRAAKLFKTKLNAALLKTCNSAGHTEVIKLLISQGGVDVNSRDKNNETSLMALCREGYVDAARLLIENGALVETGDSGSKLFGEETSLMKACAKGHFETVKLLIENKANCNAIDAKGETPLVKACKKFHIQTARLLLQNGANVDFKDEYGDTLLIWASKGGHYDLAKMLVEFKAVVDTKEDNMPGETALMKACSNGHVDIARLLLFGNKANVNAESGKDGTTSLMKACSGGHFETVKLLLDSKANIHAASKGGDTAILRASRAGHTDVVRLLILKGANVNAATELGYTPLIRAVERGHFDTVKLLTESGCDVNVSEHEFGLSPLMYACKRGYIDIVRHLIGSKADVNTTDNVGGTPLFSSCEGGFSKIVKLLVDSDADVNARDKDGRTCLMEACYRGHYYIAKLLIDNKAEVNAEGGMYRLTSLMKACHGGNIEIVKLLIENGADVNAKDKDGETSLLITCIGSRMEIFKLLLAHKADVNIKNDKYGRTPLMKACNNGLLEMVKLIIEHRADASVLDIDGKCAVDYAKEKGHQEIVKFIDDYNIAIAVAKAKLDDEACIVM